MNDNFENDSYRQRFEHSNTATDNKNINPYHVPPPMSFIEAVKVCFDKYAEFEGRARRSEFWYFKLFTLLVVLSMYVLAGISYLIHESLAIIFMCLVVLFALATFIPNLAVTVRRFHDAGQSGWLLLLDLFCTGGIISIIFGCIDSQLGHNQYGPNPKGMANDW